MEFVLYCIDKPGRAEVRRQARVPHLQYVSGRQDAFRYGGPLIDADGNAIGSLMILSLPDRAALDRHMKGDPFFGADLFETVTVWESRQVLPERIPGALLAELEQQRQVALA
jgi:uncharacterized protein YciI